MSEEYTPLQRAIVKSKITNKSYFIYLEDYDDIEFGVKNSVGELKLYLIVPIKYIQDNVNYLYLKGRGFLLLRGNLRCRGSILHRRYFGPSQS